MQTNIYHDSWTKNNRCFEKFYSMWVLNVYISLPKLLAAECILFGDNKLINAQQSVSYSFAHANKGTAFFGKNLMIYKEM